ncbi:MAG: DNA polymerase III subunit alpha, partial [Desulfatiglandales bacterium]
ELSLIREKGYCHYFLLVEDIARQSLRTCGRGSAAASIVSYGLGITHVDPIAHNLMFERFLNPKRSDPPDIDLDFAWDERDGILRYVFEKYGKEKVALVANHNTFGLRAALRSVARVLGLPEGEIGELIKEVEFFGHGINPSSLPLRWQRVLSVARRIYKHFYHLSTHCGGVVITPDSIRNHCPIEISPKGYQVLQWEKDGVEEGGLVKIDLLGNRSLGVVRDGIKMVIENYSLNGSVDSIYASLNPLKDKETLKIFYRADTMGVFYFESPATRRLLTQVSHGIDFEEYIKKDPFGLNVVVTSIIRPASNKSINTWLERLHGKPWEYPHPLLRPVLEETLGVMVFQEQLSQAAIYLAGFDSSEADELRKVVSKKHKEKRLKDFYIRFVEGARKKGVGKGVIEEVWKMMMGFDGYSFCKPHSASYTLLAYKSAYLKAHYPSEFMAAVIANRGGYYTTFAYISEAKRLGIDILSPHINESHVDTKGKGKIIRLGFSEIKNLNRDFAELIVSEREKRGPFRSLDDFLKRLKQHITWEQLRLLVRANCFLGLSKNGSIRDTMWEALLKFRAKDKFFESKRNIHFFPDQTLLEKAKIEVQAFGYPISLHPLELFNIKLPGLIKSNQLHKYVGKEISIVGWWISHKFIHTIHREEMLFITFEDQSGLFEVVVFPDTYKRFSRILDYTPYPYLIKGKVDEDRGAICVELRHIGILDGKGPLYTNNPV